MSRKKKHEVIYVLTSEDVDNVAKELGMPQPTRRDYAAVREALELFYAYGPCSWYEAIADALRDGKVAHTSDMDAQLT